MSVDGQAQACRIQLVQFSAWRRFSTPAMTALSAAIGPLVRREADNFYAKIVGAIQLCHQTTIDLPDCLSREHAVNSQL